MKKVLPVIASLTLVLGTVSCKDTSEITIQADEVYEAPAAIEVSEIPQVEADTTLVDSVVVDTISVE